MLSLSNQSVSIQAVFKFFEGFLNARWLTVGAELLSLISSFGTLSKNIVHFNVIDGFGFILERHAIVIIFANGRQLRCISIKWNLLHLKRLS